MNHAKRQLLLISMFVSGCVHPVPVAVHRYSPEQPVPTQKLLEVALHWQDLAKDVAAKISTYIIKNQDLIHKGLVIRSGNSDPGCHRLSALCQNVFDRAFYDLLTSQLAQRNVNVSNSDHSNFYLEFSEQIISHDRHRPSGIPLHLAFDKFFGVVDDPLYPKNEVIVTSKLVLGSQVLYGTTNIYYLSAEELNNYLTKRHPNATIISGVQE
ncbi:MAG: hypothetical protein HQM00_02620 [Magnetococcales bacterium]|nr:hypothetical protein [Magnetococcales bacterium]